MEKLLKAIVVIAIGSVLTLAISPVPARAQEFFIANIDGSQEVPPSGSPATGGAAMVFDGAQLCYAILYTDFDLLGPETAAHFHSPAAPGENAPVRFPISPIPSPFGSPKTGCVGAGEFSDDDAANLRAGLFYINIHTSMFPGGEIRGQVVPLQ